MRILYLKPQINELCGDKREANAAHSQYIIHSFEMSYAVFPIDSITIKKRKHIWEWAVRAKESHRNNFELSRFKNWKPRYGFVCICVINRFRVQTHTQNQIVVNQNTNQYDG